MKIPCETLFCLHLLMKFLIFYFWIRSLCGRQLTRSVSTLYFYLLIRSVMWQQKTVERLKESRRILKEFIYHLVSLVGIFQSFIWIHKWAFHSIFVTWFLVVFDYQVTKILPTSLFTFFTEQDKTGTRGNENLATYFWYFGSFDEKWSYENM